MWKAITTAALCVALTGCGDKLTDIVSKKFPPVTEDQQRAKAVEDSSENVSRIHTASVGFGVAFSDINSAEVFGNIKEKGITALTLSGQKQLIKADITFDKAFSGADFPAEPAASKILDALKPRVAGKISLYAGITGEIKGGAEDSTLTINLLPVLSSVQIDKVTASGSYDIDSAGKALEGVINRFRDNVSGEIARQSVTSVTLPLVAKNAFNPSQMIKIEQSDVKGHIDVKSGEIAPPFKLDGIAWLVKEKSITVLVQLSPQPEQGRIDTPIHKHTFDSLVEDFEARLADLGLQGGSEGTWVAVRKDVTALALNSVMSQASLCVTPKIQVQNQHTENQITLPNGSGVDCTQTKVCGQRACTFSKHADDTRDCNECIAYAPRICAFGGCTGGQCIQRWNNPVCEAAKAAQNLIYLTDANARKADCDRLAVQEKLTCEAEKAGAKALCEIQKEALDALARTGKFANLDVDASVQTQEMNVCIKDFQMASGLERLSFGLDVTGGAEAKVNVKFVPLDIVGHLTCVMDWTKEQTFQASLRDTRIGIAADIALLSAVDGFYAAAVIDNIGVKAKLSPGPTEVLLKSPELVVKCPVLAAVAPTVITLTPFVPALKGEIDYQIPKQSAKIKISVPEQNIGGRKLQVALTNNTKALVARGIVQKSSNQ